MADLLEAVGPHAGVAGLALADAEGRVRHAAGEAPARVRPRRRRAAGPRSLRRSSADRERALVPRVPRRGEP